MMYNSTGGVYQRDQMAKYRYQRYQQSLNENGNFYFSVKSLLLFGASSFLYELMPSGGNQANANNQTIGYFFGPEQLPPNWYSRVIPYTIPLVANEIFAQYQEYPVAFGGNTGKPNTFVGIGEYGPYFSNSSFNGTAQGLQCFLYQIATGNQPSSLQGSSNVPTANFQWAASKLNPVYQNAGSPCPLNYNNA